MATSGSTSQLEGTRQRKITPELKRKLNRFEEPDSRFDSGLGSMPSCNSLVSDRSNTQSFSDDSCRDQKCCDSSDSMDLVRETRKLNIDDDCEISDSIDGKERKNEHTSIDDGYTSLSSTQSSCHFYIWMCEYVRSFAQTPNLRHILAPIWPTLLNRNEDGDTALHLAIINCNEEVILAFLDVLPAGPQYVDIYNDLTQSPLHLAVITGQYKIVGKLIEKGANIDLVDRNGQTCIHLACHRGDLKSLRTIFKRRQGRVELEEKLQENLDARNFDGLTPLCVATKANHVDIVKELIALGADVNAVDSKSGNTALHLAVEDNNLPMLSCLLFQGHADPNVMSYSDNTPLHIAAGLELEAVIATLIAVGANASVENLEGDTAFRIASESDQDSVDASLAEMDC